VTHFSRMSTVVIDVPTGDHDRELAFWEAAVGQSLSQFDYPEYHGGQLLRQDFWLLIQRLGGGAARVHVDIHTDDVDAEVERLERLGAQRVQRAHSWWVMPDPAGLLFLVIPDPSGTLNDGNAHRWE
jgi:predicted enzyme related to lactoylglutathione lyase